MLRTQGAFEDALSADTLPLINSCSDRCQVVLYQYELSINLVYRYLQQCCQPISESPDSGEHITAASVAASKHQTAPGAVKQIWNQLHRAAEMLQVAPSPARMQPTKAQRALQLLWFVK